MTFSSRAKSKEVSLKSIEEGLIFRRFIPKVEKHDETMLPASIFFFIENLFFQKINLYYSQEKESFLTLTTPTENTHVPYTNAQLLSSAIVARRVPWWSNILLVQVTHSCYFSPKLFEVPTNVSFTQFPACTELLDLLTNEINRAAREGIPYVIFIHIILII